MRIPFCLLILLSLSLSQSLSTSQQMISALESEIAKIAASTPSNAATYVQNIHSLGSFNSDSFHTNMTKQVLQQKLKLPQVAIDKFTNIIFSDSLTFQTFTASLNQQVAYISEFVGAARRVGDIAEIAFIQVSSSGNPITQYQSVGTRHCHTSWLVIHHCSTDYHNVPRGFTTAELQVIFTALRASAYTYLQTEIKSPPSSLAHFDSMRASLLSTNAHLFNATRPASIVISSLGSSGQSLIEQLITNILNKVPAIERDIQENKTVVVDKIVNRGFTSFKEQAAVEQYTGVEDAHFKDFLANLKAEIALPAEYETQFDEIMQVTLFSTSNVWVVFNLVFSIKQGADCKFVCVMASHDVSNLKTDWLIANVGASFELAPDLLVVQTRKSYLWGAWSDSKETIVLKPAAITEKQLEVVFEFFEVVAFQRFAEILHINNPNGVVLREEKPLGDVIAALTLVKSAITLVTSTWQSIVSAFKTTKTSELKEILQGKGFSYFAESGEMQKVTGMVESYYDTFANELIGRVQVPDDKKTAFLQFFQDFKYIQDDNVWKAFQTVFSVGTGGQCKFVALLAHHNTAAHTMDLLIADFTATFKLAPNVAVIQESASYAGGIYSNSKVVFKEMPRDVTTDDLNAVFDFFYVVAFKNFGDLVDVKVDFPKL